MILHYLLAVLLVLCVALWLVRRYRERHSVPLCPDCVRWHCNTCSIPERPEVTRCRHFMPFRVPQPLSSEEIESLDETETG